MNKVIISGLIACFAINIQAEDVLSKYESTLIAKNQQNFKCDGRKYCSQMRSCAEAKYFIKHCPNTKMDGNHDGIPCEKQWCRK